MPSRIPDINKVRQLIPPLTGEMHKGQAGKCHCHHSGSFQ